MREREKWRERGGYQHAIKICLFISIAGSLECLFLKRFGIQKEFHTISLQDAEPSGRLVARLVLKHYHRSNGCTSTIDVSEILLFVRERVWCAVVSLFLCSIIHGSQIAADRWERKCRIINLSQRMNGIYISRSMARDASETLFVSNDLLFSKHGSVRFGSFESSIQHSNCVCVCRVCLVNKRLRNHKFNDLISDL